MRPDTSWERSSAEISPCGLYRYELTRWWDEDAVSDKRAPLVVVGLNPSTADETQDDPTIRRLIVFAKTWEFPGLRMLNLFAYRATNPFDLYDAHLAGVDVVGGANDAIIEARCADAPVVLCAWGIRGDWHGRDSRVLNLVPIQKRRVLGLTKDGYPKHPLYVNANEQPVPWYPR